MAAYNLIATITVGVTSVASIEFGSIPQTYTDLVLKCSLRGNGGATIRSVKINVNGNTSAIYSGKILESTGTSTSSASTSGDPTLYWGGVANDTSSTANLFSNTDIYISNYAGSSNKSISIDSVVENNASYGHGRLAALLASTASAISLISIIGETNFIQYSSASLYGIKNS